VSDDFEAALANLTPERLLAEPCPAGDASIDQRCDPDPLQIPDDADPQWALWCPPRIWAAMETMGIQLTTHPQVQASRARVDEELAELLEAVWAAGIATQYSCQGGIFDETGKPAEAHIVFSTVAGAVRFMHRTMTRSRCYDGLTLKLAEPIWDYSADQMGPTRAVVTWPHHVTQQLTDVWTGRDSDEYPPGLFDNVTGLPRSQD
jgi:hypothetical protein